MKLYLGVLKNYAVFNGRSRREEFWMFTLFNFIFLTIAAVIDNILGVTFDNNYSIWGVTFKINSRFLGYGVSPNGYVYLTYTLAVLIPAVAVLVRRLHDVGKSGWFALIPVYNLILVCTSGMKGGNLYGADPKNLAGTRLPTRDYIQKI